jgi:cardiolipin synthase
MASALARQAEKGLTVRVLLDAFGSARMSSDLIDEMTDAGADVRLFRPLRRRDMLKVTSRTHRKILVCDRRVAFTGGVGIAEEWEGDARNPDEWRETHFRLTGPVVDGLHAAFMENWAEAARFTVDEHPMHAPPRDGDALTHVICSTGGAACSEMRLTTLALIAAARRSLVLVTAYFVPDEELIEALLAARRRGVDIAVMLPGTHSDWRLCNLASGQEITRLVEHGVHVHLYERTMLHAKIMIVDGEACLIGSPNLNQRSMKLDDEVGVLVIDPNLARRLTDDFEADLEACEPFDAERWRDRSPMQRVVEETGRRFRSKL